MQAPTSPLGSGLGPRERRWLVVFLVLASAYVGLLLVQALVAVFAAFSQIALILFLAWLLAFVMAGPVAALQRETKLPRPAVVVVCYLVALFAIGFLLFSAGTAITQQIGELTDTFPATAVQIEATLRSWQPYFEVGGLRIDLIDTFRSARDQAETLGAAIFEQAQAIAGATIVALGSLILIIILSLYMVMDSDRILAKLKRLVPRRYADEVEIFERSVARAFGGFLRAQLILAGLQAALVAVIGIVFGMPYLFLVGTVSALLMLIPFFGPPLALIPPLVAAAIYTSEAFLPIAIILLAAQTLVVNWLQPRLMQGALGMHPILVLVGLLLGAQVAGVWGALFGIPVIAVINVFFNYFFFRAIPNAALPDEERLAHVEEHVMVSVEKQQLGDETHPHIHVHRSLRPDGSEEVRLEVGDERREEGDAPA